jgi:two-component system, chemotaxis family, chemotaxis protein CheY
VKPARGRHDPYGKTTEDRRMRALVIDDSRATRAILRRLLEQLDHEVLEAGEGRQGLAVLEEEAERGGIDLALVDWNMPIMDGLQFVQAVRARPEYDQVVLMMVTTEGDADHMVKALDAGANEYAMKPFTASVIEEKLALLGLTNQEP